MVEILCKDARTGNPYRRLFHRSDIVTVIEDEKTHEASMVVKATGLVKKKRDCSHVIDLAESYADVAAKLEDLWWKNSREYGAERANNVKK